MAPVKETLKLTINYFDPEKCQQFGKYITGQYSLQLQEILAQKVIDKFLKISGELGIQGAEPIGLFKINYRILDWKTAKHTETTEQTETTECIKIGQLKVTFDYSIPKASSRKTQQLKQSLKEYVNPHLLDAVLKEFEDSHKQRIRKAVQQARAKKRAISQPAGGAQLQQDSDVRRPIPDYLPTPTPPGFDWSKAWSKARHSPDAYMPAHLPRPYSIGKQAPSDSTQGQGMRQIKDSQPPPKKAPSDRTQTLKQILGLTGSKPPPKKAPSDRTKGQGMSIKHVRQIEDSMQANVPVNPFQASEPPKNAATNDIIRSGMLPSITRIIGGRPFDSSLN